MPTVGTTRPQKSSSQLEVQAKLGSQNKGWFTAGFILCITCAESTTLKSNYCTLTANIGIYETPLPLGSGMNNY